MNIAWRAEMGQRPLANSQLLKGVIWRGCLAVAIVVATIVVVGVPSSRASGFLLMGALVAVFVVGRDWQHNLRTLSNWVPFVVLMFIYDRIRSVADELGVPVQYDFPILVDRLLCQCYATPLLRNWVPTSARTGDVGAYWYEAVFAVTYGTHFVLPYGAALYLWLADRKRFLRYRDTFFLLTFSGLLVYLVVPTAPPWMAGDAGLLPGVDTSARTVGNGWRLFGFGWADAVLEQGRSAGNPVAAIPSLHAAYSMFVTLMFWSSLSWVVRIGPVRLPGAKVLLGFFPLVMGFTLILTAEHYIFDVLLGWIFAGGAIWILGSGRYELLRSSIAKSVRLFRR